MVYKQNQPPKSDGKPYIAQRYVLGFMGFFALINAYVQRFSMSLAITEMASIIYHPSSNNSINTECPGGITPRNFTSHNREFDWSEKTQGLILSSVFCGYVLTQLPGGLIAEKYGAKHTLGLGMLCSTLSTLFIPIVVRYADSVGLIIMRFIIGLGQGAVYPSINVLLARWAPITERGRLGALVFAGAQIGNVISMGMSGFLIKYSSWSTMFYVYGILGLIWYCMWLLLVYNEPTLHPFISEKEKTYLTEKVKHVMQQGENLPSPPWKRIFSSCPIWGLIIAQVGHDWGLFTIISDMPKYMNSVLHFSVEENGVLSALPYALMWFVAIISGYVTDFLIENKNWHITTVRKLFITIASLGPGLGMLGVTYSYCDKLMASAVFTVGMGTMGAFVPSLKVNCLDLSPNYAGTIMAIVGGIGAFSGIIAPYLVGTLVTNGTLLEWRVVFWISFFILLITNFIYLWLGSGEVQPWNDTNLISPLKGEIQNGVAMSNLKHDGTIEADDRRKDECQITNK